MGKKTKRIILIDADVVSHFIKAGEIYAIKNIFPNEIKILDKVYKELEKHAGKKIQIDNLINQNIIEIYQFPEANQDIKKEYFYIKNKLFKGEGESACLAVVRYTNNIIASSNLKDIKHYCTMHSIDYLTTMDFLCEALKIGLFDVSRCNAFITSVISKGSILPVAKMEEYTCRQLNIT
jgi:predicted nucleic acid-binding protein